MLPRESRWNLHGVGQVSCVGSALYRACTTSHNGIIRDLDDLDRDLSDLSDLDRGLPYLSDLDRDLSDLSYLSDLDRDLSVRRVDLLQNEGGHTQREWWIWDRTNPERMPSIIWETRTTTIGGLLGKASRSSVLSLEACSASARRIFSASFELFSPLLKRSLFFVFAVSLLYVARVSQSECSNRSGGEEHVRTKIQGTK